MRSIRWQMLFPILLVCIISFASLFWAVHTRWKSYSLELTSQWTADKINFFQDQVDDELDRKIRITRQMAAMIRSLDEKTDRNQRITNYVRDLLIEEQHHVKAVWFEQFSAARNDEKFSPWFVMTDGKAEMVQGNDIDGSLMTYADDPDYDYFHGPRKTGNTYVTEPYEDPDIHVLMISISTPVTDRDGTFIGVAGVDMTLEDIQSVGASFRLDGVGLILLTKDGTVIDHPDHDLIFKRNVLTDEPEEMKALFQNALEQKQLMRQESADGNTYYYSAHTPSTDWTVWITVPLTVITGEVNELSRWMLMMFLLFLLLTGLIVFHTLNRNVLNPMDVLIQGVNRLAAGDLLQRVKLEQNKEFSYLGEQFNAMTIALQGANEELQAMNEQLEERVRERTRAISLLLNFAGQGFLTIGKDGTTDDEYSRECLNLFGHPVGNIDLMPYLSGKSDAQTGFIRDILNYLWDEAEPSQLDATLGLLPAEISVLGRPIGIAYRPVHDDEGKLYRLLLILSDLSERKKIEQQLREEERLMRMVLKVVTNKQDLLDTIEEFRVFYREYLQNIVNSKLRVDQWISETKRHVHTLKGNTGRFGMVRAVERINQLEQELGDFAGCSPDVFRQFALTYDWESLMHEELSYLTEILGESFFHPDASIPVSRQMLLELEEQIRQTSALSDGEQLQSAIRQLYFRPLKDMLEKYPSFALYIAQRNQKSVEPFEVTGDDVYVDQEYYKPLINSLIHLYRNMVDHGVETPEERLDAGKPTEAVIRTSVHVTDDWIKIVVSDDGKGISAAAIRERAVRNGVLSKEQVDMLSDHDALYLILEEGISTKDQVTDLSGRGVGMSAVKKELDLIGGGFLIESVEGEGTTFTLMLPAGDRVAGMKLAE